MVAEAEHPVSPLDHRPCQSLEVGQADAFRRQADPFQQAEPRCDAGEAGRPQTRIGQHRIERRPLPGQPSDEPRRQRQLQQCAEAMRAIGPAAEVGTAVGGETGVGNDAGVHLVAQLLQQGGGVGSEAVAPGPVDFGSRAEIDGDRLGQGRQLAPFQLARQVAGVGVGPRHHLVIGRVDPGMEMGADLAFPHLHQPPEHRHRSGRRRHRPIHQIGGNNAPTVEQWMDVGLRRDGCHRDRVPREGLRPVELLFGVDDHDKLGGGFSHPETLALRPGTAHIANARTNPSNGVWP